MNIFYCEHIEGQEAQLSGEEARHCAQVLRKKTGSPIVLVDGKGGYYEGELQSISKQHCLVRITSHIENYQPLPYQLHLAIAPTKNPSRMEWFLEKATEIGISKITPLYCKHSERKHIRTDRYEKVLISAMKQSLKAYKPHLEAPLSFKDFLETLSKGNEQRFIAHCRYPINTLLKSAYSATKDALILIGPEGDFNEEEVKLALGSGFEEISLGKSRLRTETAGIVACHTVYLSNS